MVNKNIKLEEYTSEQVYLKNIFVDDFIANYNNQEVRIKAGQEYMLERGKAQIIATQMANKFFEGSVSTKCDELGVPMHPQMKEFFDKVVREDKMEVSSEELGIVEVQKESEEEFDVQEIDKKNKWTFNGISYPSLGAYAAAVKKFKKAQQIKEAEERELAIEENKSEEEKLEDSKNSKEKKIETEADFEENPEEDEE